VYYALPKPEKIDITICDINQLVGGGQTGLDYFSLDAEYACLIQASGVSFQHSWICVYALNSFAKSSTSITFAKKISKLGSNLK
jgi:hypothetical protein